MAWARTDLRARWRPLLALALIAGVTAGLAIACVVGADRTGTALARLEARTNASDAVVFASQAGVATPDWTALADRPEVAAVAPWALVFGEIREVDEPGEELFFVPSDDRFLQTVDRPIVVEGRMWDPTADDELVVAEGFADDAGIRIGDTFGFTPFTAADLGPDFELVGGELQGPDLEMRVVGIVRTPLEPLFVADGLVLAPPGLLDRHPEVVALENAVVQLRGEGVGPAFQRHADADVAEGVPVLDLGAVARRVTTTTDVARTVLLLLAAAIVVAGLVLAGQVVSRSAAGVAADARTLQAMGMQRRDVAGATTIAHLPAALVAVVVCVATAVGVSTLVPFGLAGRLDPETGLRVDPLVTAAGAALLLVLVLGGAFAAAWRATHDAGPSLQDEGRGLVGWLRQRSSVVVGLGATMGLRRMRGRGGVPVRPALAGAVVGVLGVAAATTVDAGLRDALAHPERAGVVWDAIVSPPPEDLGADGVDGRLLDRVGHVTGVEDLAEVDHGVASVAGVGLPSFVTRPVAGDRDATRLALLGGRPPQVPGEAALGPASARALDVGIGDTVDLGGELELRIVGEVVFPSDVHAGFDEGIWLTPADFDALPALHDTAERLVAVRFAQGADPATTLEALRLVVEERGGTAEAAEVPPELTNLRDVVPLPRWLAAFLAALAVAALLHVLASSARARAREFAILRALGVTRRGTRLLLHVQGAAVFLVGLLAGVPLGIAAGRLGWRLVAERVPLREVTSLAVLALALLVVVALLLSQLVAIGPARRVQRMRPAEVLRSE